MEGDARERRKPRLTGRAPSDIKIRVVCGLMVPDGQITVFLSSPFGKNISVFS
jgi:hypothetical protein